MKKYIALSALLMCLSIKPAIAQVNIYSDFAEKNAERYVFGDTVFVRQNFGITHPVIDTLFVGDDVNVLATDTSIFALKGFSAPWVKVQYKKSGTPKEGYLWSGLLSFNCLRRGEVKFVFGIDYCTKKVVTHNGENYDDYQTLIKVKVVKSGIKIHQQQFVLDGAESMSYVEGKVTNHKGLDKVQYLLDLNFSGEACGIPSYTKMFAWNGKQLNPLPLLTSISDAGVFYDHESFIFPADKKGKKGMIGLLKETGEETEKLDKKGNPIFKESISTSWYTWNGEKAVKVSK